jgi:hypothetical protein
VHRPLERAQAPSVAKKPAGNAIDGGYGEWNSSEIMSHPGKIGNLSACVGLAPMQ